MEGQTITNDDPDMTSAAIRAFVDRGCGMICVTGGMSVDPDDQTPTAIRNAGARIVAYGAPVYPGAMFLLSYIKAPQGEVPVLGLPGCVMYNNASILTSSCPACSRASILRPLISVSWGTAGSAVAARPATSPTADSANRTRTRTGPRERHSHLVQGVTSCKRKLSS